MNKTHDIEPKEEHMAEEPVSENLITEYDYIVVGGGSAGAVVAARLSEDPEISVALVEAGDHDLDHEMVLQLNRWPEMLESGLDWDYPIEPQENGNSFMRHARAKVLGGCSSHNSCIAFHPPAEDMDLWEQMGAEGWSAETMLPLIKRLESNQSRSGERHGTDGPVELMDAPPNDPVGVALLEAWTPGTLWKLPDVARQVASGGLLSRGMSPFPMLLLTSILMTVMLRKMTWRLPTSPWCSSRTLSA